MYPASFTLALSQSALVSQITVTYPALWCQPDSRQTLLEGQSGGTGILLQTPRLLPLISPDKHLSSTEAQPS